MDVLKFPASRLLFPPPLPPPLFVLKPKALPTVGGCGVNGGVFTGALRPLGLLEMVVVAGGVFTADQLNGDDDREEP